MSSQPLSTPFAQVVKKKNEERDTILALSMPFAQRVTKNQPSTCDKEPTQQTNIKKLDRVIVV